MESFVGGLGDVAGALPKALARRGHRVMVLLFSYVIFQIGSISIE